MPDVIWFPRELPKVDLQFKSQAPNYANFQSANELPIEYFRKFSKDSMISHITDATNEYSSEKRKNSIDVKNICRNLQKIIWI